MASDRKTLLSEEQDLEIERKSEFHDGEMFAMAGRVAVHHQLFWNVIAQLGGQLGSGPCRGCPSDIARSLGEIGLYTYPELLVVCGGPN